MGLGHVAMAAVSAEAAKTRFGPFALNARRPTRATCTRCCTGRPTAQKEKYLRPLCDGRARSCFAMTEPEVAGSDPTLIQTRAVRDGDDWVVNGHKWFISGARGAKFAILIARTEDDPEIPQAGNTRVHRRHPVAGLGDRARRRDDGGRPQPLRDPDQRTCACRRRTCSAGAGRATCSASARLGPARLAHCMRWIGQAEIGARHDGRPRAEALRARLAALREAGHPVDDRRRGMELYQCKLMVLHAAYKIDRGEDFRSEVSMAKHFVANTLEPDHRPRDPGARRARLLDGHAARAAWRRRRAGRASPTAPTRCTSGASRSARSSPGRRPGASPRRRAGSRSRRASPARRRASCARSGRANASSKPRPQPDDGVSKLRQGTMQSGSRLATPSSLRVAHARRADAARARAVDRLAAVEVDAGRGVVVDAVLALRSLGGRGRVAAAGSSG